jgi:hypothetical protein
MSSGRRIDDVGRDRRRRFLLTERSRSRARPLGRVRSHPGCREDRPRAHGSTVEAMVSNEYSFRVRGRISPDILAALHPLRPTAVASETELRGHLVDQAALHGIIARLEQLGVELVGLNRLPDHR